MWYDETFLMTGYELHGSVDAINLFRNTISRCYKHFGENSLLTLQMHQTLGIKLIIGESVSAAVLDSRYTMKSNVEFTGTTGVLELLLLNYGESHGLRLLAPLKVTIEDLVDTRSPTALRSEIPSIAIKMLPTLLIDAEERRVELENDGRLTIDLSSNKCIERAGSWLCFNMFPAVINLDSASLDDKQVWQIKNMDLLRWEDVYSQICDKFV